jgi:amidase
MKRRDFVQNGLLLSAAHTLSTHSSFAENKAFSVVESSVAQIQEAMKSGRLTSTTLVSMYLARIESIDKSGSKLHSIIELNPEAKEIAAQLDGERKTKGPRGALHGMCVLLKDNIATADKMQTTAGSLALIGAKAPRDAFLVKKLRDAGAVILGKTNLSEWANFRSTRSTSGWSGRGGLTKNPYALNRNTSGSSSGSAAAMAASLATLAVGTETDGSITSPASICGLVGLKPTLGLISRDGIVPIAHSQDTAGPMTRTVADAAVMLSVLAGVDARDVATAKARVEIDYTKFLDADALGGCRIGVVRSAMASNARVQVLVEAAKTVLKGRGAILVDVDLPKTADYSESENEVLLYEFKADLNRYLSEFGSGAKVKTLQDLIAFNEENKAREMPYFDQELFLQAQAKGALDSKEYLSALALNRKLSATEGIDKVLKENTLDALFGLTGGPAWITDYVNGDHYGDSFTTPAAVAGYPHITVPAGFYEGLPIGISFVASAYSEGKLISLAFAYEQATKHRRAPSYRAQ